jgi:hypothetical protein
MKIVIETTDDGKVNFDIDGFKYVGTRQPFGSQLSPADREHEPPKDSIAEVVKENCFLDITDPLVRFMDDHGPIEDSTEVLPSDIVDEFHDRW